MTTAAAVGRVALTFDAEHPDRPTTPGNEARLLDTLAALGIRATFFVQGRWAEAQPRLARRIADGGHLVGSHSHYHVRLPLLTDDGVADDIRIAETAIVDATGADPRPWFRCPFGTGMDDPRVLAAIGAAGYRHVGWDVTAEDWDPDRTASEVEEGVVAGTLAHGDGAVVLLHSWPDQMLDALPGIVGRLRAGGWTFVRLDVLERVPEVDASIDAPASSRTVARSPGAP
ncbi:MAG TPA: polysaccharide deacetylase family protein [Candidatus Limnocylindrales bacterium]|nr:polysaccharide deacetylase family protein [Candidatus Limnocylindrales bacterium]